nr:hypothetical protein [Candidatus Microthrix sp.]
MIAAIWTIWVSVRFSGFFSNTNRVPLNAFAASGSTWRMRAHCSRRVVSRALVAIATAWNGSRQIAALGAICRVALAYGAPKSIEIASNWAILSPPSCSKNASR